MTQLSCYVGRQASMQVKIACAGDFFLSVSWRKKGLTLNVVENQRPFRLLNSISWKSFKDFELMLKTYETCSRYTTETIYELIALQAISCRETNYKFSIYGEEIGRESVRLVWREESSEAGFVLGSMME